jgi:hypothetical protein
MITVLPTPFCPHIQHIISSNNVLLACSPLTSINRVKSLKLLYYVVQPMLHFLAWVKLTFEERESSDMCVFSRRNREGLRKIKWDKEETTCGLNRTGEMRKNYCCKASTENQGDTR